MKSTIKERFEYYPKQNQLYDKINDELYCLGIKQDKTRLVDFLNLMNGDWWTLYERNKELREEKQQLKQQLADYTKQVRNEVVQEIKDLAGDYFELPYCDNCGETNNDDVVLTGNDLTEILDQIQGETK